MNTKALKLIRAQELKAKTEMLPIERYNGFGIREDKIFQPLVDRTMIETDYIKEFEDIIIMLIDAGLTHEQAVDLINSEEGNYIRCRIRYKAKEDRDNLKGDYSIGLAQQSALLKVTQELEDKYRAHKEYQKRFKGTGRWARYTEEEALDAYDLYKRGHMKVKEIAEMWGISSPSVSYLFNKIKNGEKVNYRKGD